MRDTYYRNYNKLNITVPIEVLCSFSVIPGLTRNLVLFG